MSRRAGIVLRLGALLAVLLPLAAEAQTGARLTVRAPVPGLAVMLDSVQVGRTPLDSLPIGEGVMVLRVLPLAGRSWSGPVVIETLAVRAGDHVVRDVEFPAIRRVTSEPFGAGVFYGDSLLGATPMLLPGGIDGGMVRITLAGYEDAVVPFTGDLHVVLAPRAGTVPSYLATEISGNMTPVYAATGATVLAGAAAAYFKIKADSHYADYRRSGSDADLDKVQRYDLLSGISLAVSEISLFVLTYQLLSR